MAGPTQCESWHNMRAQHNLINGEWSKDFVHKHQPSDLGKRLATQARTSMDNRHVRKHNHRSKDLQQFREMTPIA